MVVSLLINQVNKFANKITSLLVFGHITTHGSHYLGYFIVIIKATVGGNGGGHQKLGFGSVERCAVFVLACNGLEGEAVSVKNLT